MKRLMDLTDEEINELRNAPIGLNFGDVMIRLRQLLRSRDDLLLVSTRSPKFKISDDSPVDEESAKHTSALCEEDWVPYLQELERQWECAQKLIFAFVDKSESRVYPVGEEQNSLVCAELEKLPGGTERRNFFTWLLTVGLPPNKWHRSFRDAITNPDGSNNTLFFERLVPDHASLSNREISERLKELGVNISHKSVPCYYPRK